MSQPKVLLFDLAYVLLYPKDPNYHNELNALYKSLKESNAYHFDNHFYLDREMVSYVTKLRSKYKVYMFTSGIIQENSEIEGILKSLFIEIYSAEGMGVSKKDPNAYIAVCNQIGIIPSDVLFIDDTEANTVAAAKAKLQTHLFRGIEGLKSKINDIKADINNEKKGV